MASPKAIIHVDMDAFYAAIEVLDNPKLKGKPVIVGGLGKRGVVATASYEARAFGVHSALPTAIAHKRCPEGIFLAGRPARYREVSEQIAAIWRKVTPLVEPLALDEAFLDVTGSLRLFGSAVDIAKRLRAEILAETGLTASAGVASQKHLAKIASGFQKPNGLTVVPVGGELDFLWPLPLNQLWGVGKVTLKQLNDLGLITIGDLANTDRALMEKHFGLSGGHLWLLANGCDPREVVPEVAPKSIGSEETYRHDLKTADEIKAALLTQAVTVVNRLRMGNYQAKTVTLKLRDHKFKTKTRARTLNPPTDLRGEIFQLVIDIYEKEASTLAPLRLVGVTLSNLSPKGKEAPSKPPALSLFDQETEKSFTKPHQLNQALDHLTKRFGNDVLRPASSLAPGETQTSESSQKTKKLN